MGSLQIKTPNENHWASMLVVLTTVPPSRHGGLANSDEKKPIGF